VSLPVLPFPAIVRTLLSTYIPSSYSSHAGIATHFVEIDESCVSIVNTYQNFTAPDLYRWNPSIGLTCSGLIAGSSICINTPGYTYPGPIQAGAIWTAVQNPVPQMPDIVAGCKYFEYTDAKGNPSLEQILSDNGITRTQWNAWNWYKDTAAYNSKWGSYFSCVGR
jgi:hypothetical protein